MGFRLTGVDTRVLLRLAIVENVNPDSYTIDAQFVSSEAPTETAILGGGYVSLRGPGWIGALPERGDMVLLAKPERSSNWIVISYIPHQVVKEIEGDDGEGEESAPRDSYRGARPRIQEGEMAMMGPSGGHLLIRRDGNVEIQASPLCMSSFFKDDHCIKTVCQNFILEGFFGTSRYWTHRDHYRDGADATPTGYSLQLKSLAQHAPNIYVDAGAVMEEEDLPGPGYPTRSKNAFGLGACVRVLVFEQGDADNSSSAGVTPPSPNQAKIQLKLYPSGNIVIVSKGTVFMEARDRASRVYGREYIESDVTEHRCHGDYTVTAAGGIHLKSHAKLDISCPGDFSQTSKGNYFIGAGKGRFKFKGGVETTCEGGWYLESQGNGMLNYGGGLSIAAVKDLGTVVGGRYSLKVLAKDVLENLGRDVVTHRTEVKEGKYLTQVEKGSLELKLGLGLSPALAYFRMHNDLLNTPYIGRVEAGTLAGARLILEPTGGWQIAGLAGTTGSIHSDASGRIQLGPVLGAAGYVVTTASHRCYITGLPPLGCAEVTASSMLPGTNLPPIAPSVLPPLATVPKPEEIGFC